MLLTTDIMPSARPFVSFLFGSLGSQSPQNAPNTRQTIAQSGIAVKPVANTSAAPGAGAGPANGGSSYLTKPGPARATRSPSIDIPSSRSQSTSPPPFGARASSTDCLQQQQQQKWWIGGRAADGSEKFYRLSPLSRHRSFDRISVDRLSI
jgi:hypothetical protein